MPLPIGVETLFGMVLPDLHALISWSYAICVHVRVVFGKAFCVSTVVIFPGSAPSDVN